MRCFLIPIALLLLGGCALPRVIILNDPLDARQHNDLGVTYEQRQEHDLALLEYNRAAKLDSSWDQPLVNQGNVFAARGDWQQAEKSYRQALRRKPANGEAMNNLAWALLQRGDTEQALEWASRAVAALPRDAACRDPLADIRLARGERAAARQAVDEALALSPGEELRRALENKLQLLDARHDVADHPAGGGPRGGSALSVSGSKEDPDHDRHNPEKLPGGEDR